MNIRLQPLVGTLALVVTLAIPASAADSFAQTLHTIRAQPAISTAYDFVSASPTAGRGVTIAIIDQGIAKALADSLGPRVRLYNSTKEADSYFDGDASESVADAHDASSTAVALIAAVAPGARILSLKVLDKSGGGTYDDIGKGIALATTLRADELIFIAAGGDGSPALNTALNRAIGGGMLVIAPSGNESATTADYPGNLSGAVAVGATDVHDAVASFSNTGPNVIYAPGVDVHTIDVVGEANTASTGTSMAAALASAIYADLWSMNRKLSAGNLTSLVNATAATITVRDATGRRIDAKRAAALIKASKG